MSLLNVFTQTSFWIPNLLAVRNMNVSAVNMPIGVGESIDLHRHHMGSKVSIFTDLQKYYDYITTLWHENAFHIIRLCEGNAVVTGGSPCSNEPFQLFIYC